MINFKIFLLVFFLSLKVLSGEISTSTTETYSIEEGSGNTNLIVTSSGSIEKDGTPAVDAESTTYDSSITTIDNSGTISGTAKYVIKGKLSTNLSILNRNSGTISGSGSSTIWLNSATNPTIINHGTIEAGTGKYTINLHSSTGASITNTGTIKTNSNNSPIYLYKTINATINNSGIISSGDDQAIKMGGNSDGADIGTTIINSGRLIAEDRDTVSVHANSIGANITNSGTITALGNRSAINANSNTSGFTLTNSGTLTADKETLFIESNATINNSGSISATSSTADRPAIHIDGDDNTITNSGTISGTDSISIVSGSTGNKIIVDGNDVSFSGEIELNSTATTFELSCGLSKDLDIEVFNKTNLVITDNLCGNDRYEILDSSQNTDGDNSETNGYIRIYAEDLDITQNFAKHRSEIFLSKLTSLFHNLNTNQGLFTYQKVFRRSEYINTMNGVRALINNNGLSKKNINYIIDYNDHNINFENNENMRAENFTFGINSKVTSELFDFSFTPMIGLADLEITDFEEEKNEKIKTTFLSQFMGVDISLEKNIKLSKKNVSSYKINTLYGAQRFPNYNSTFTDGELILDDSTDQVLGAGFEFTNTIGTKRNVKFYLGGNWRENLNNQIEVIAGGENKDVTPEMQKVFGKYFGVDINFPIRGLNFNMNIEHGSLGGLNTNIANLSLNKSF